ncbi:uncharacterized protein [Antedon mediterranea]|uniref:uncharacterized protein n=1 Tax=Antedon mediterranea TaxID=105859 RepID=UPI003AF9651B
MASTNTLCNELSRNINTMQPPAKPKRRNSEKRKEKSRNAARCRRGKETEIYYELARQLPLPSNVCQHLDKAGIMRLCISYIRTRQLIPDTIGEMCMRNKENDSKAVLDTLMDDLYIKSLDGFLYVLSQEGDIVYLSENVCQYLGLTQVELMGQSIYEYTHPCDHDEIREQLADKQGSTSASRDHHSFLLRLKCTLTDKGKTVNLKSAVYKALQCTAHKEWIETINLSTSAKTLYLVVVACPIPHPSNIEHPLDSKTFVSRHNLDMTFTDCDERIEELLGYNVSQVEGHSFYKFIHAGDNQVVEKNLKNLYAKGQSVIGRYRFLAKVGGYAWMSTEATIIYHNKSCKPQCIVCIHYMISDVEKEEEIVSLQQEVENSKTKPTASKQTNESPFLYWSPHQNKTIELDPNELDSLAPTPGEEFVPLFSSAMKDGETCLSREGSVNYSDMMDGLGDNFMDFNPFAPMDFESEDKQMSPQEVNIDQDQTDILPKKDQIVSTEQYISIEDSNMDELGMNAPLILDEECQFTTDMLTDLDGVCWNSWKEVNPFSLPMTGSVEDTVCERANIMPDTPYIDRLNTSLSKMTGLSRSMPNMSVGPASTKNDDFSRPIPTPDIATNQMFSPDNCLGIQQNISDQRNIPPDILQELPGYNGIQASQTAPRQMTMQELQILSPTPQMESQISPQPLLMLSQISPSHTLSQVSSQSPQMPSKIFQTTPPHMLLKTSKPQSSLTSPQMSPVLRQLPSEGSPLISQISTGQVSPVPIMSPIISQQGSPIISQQGSQIVPPSVLSTSTSGMMLSFPYFLLNYQSEKRPCPDRKASANLPQSDLRILKRKISIDANPIQAKLFAKAAKNKETLVKKEREPNKRNCPIDKQTVSTVDLNAWADIRNQSEYSTVGSNLTHSKLLQQVAMKANESSKNTPRSPPPSLFSTMSIASLISSSSQLDSIPLINQYDAEVNAPITSSCLLQGDELLKALDQSKGDN